MSDIFETAARRKLRFSAATHSNITVEDLFDLPLTSARGISLDAVGQKLLTDLGTTTAVQSLIPTAKASPERAELELKLEIVKSVIATRIAENESKAEIAAKRERNSKIRQIIESKKDEQLTSLSVEDLQKLLVE